MSNQRCGIAYRAGLLALIVAIFILMVWLLRSVCGWGPAVKAELPDGGHIAFRCRSTSFNETGQFLTWTKPDGSRKTFLVDSGHAAPSQIVIRLTPDKHGIWTEHPPQAVDASLNLETGEFRSSWDDQSDWAVYGQGTVISEGTTEPGIIAYASYLVVLALIVTLVLLVRTFRRRSNEQFRLPSPAK